MNWAGIGEALLLLAGAFAASHRFPLASVIVLGFALQAGSADLGYWLGRRGGRPFVERFGARFRIRPDQLARAELFFARHGDRAVLAVPFLLGLRTWGAMLAGMSRMPFPKFQLFNAIGAFVWAALVGSAGYVLGSNLAVLEAVVRAIGVGGVVFVVVIVSFVLVAQERATRRR